VEGDGKISVLKRKGWEQGDESWTAGVSVGHRVLLFLPIEISPGEMGRPKTEEAGETMCVVFPLASYKLMATV